MSTADLDYGRQRPNQWESVDMSVALWTLVIFLARVADVSLGTIRVQFIVRRQRVKAALTGFVEVLIFIVIVSRVIRDIEHWPYVLAYAGGFATGTLLGMMLADRFSRRVIQVTIVAHEPEAGLEAAVREAGFALTRYAGVGRDGPVEVLDVICTAGEMPHLSTLVTGLDPRAFLFTHELAGLRGGVVYGLKSKV
jgi:uncharacterized protein YebE (UPF0316 family)